MGASLVQPPHPFYPTEANIVGYIANEHSVLTLLAIFASTCFVVLGTSFLLLKQKRSALTGRDEATVIWFILTGCIHLFFEGYFCYFHASMPTRQDVFGQLWKEYSQSDSRYMTSDPFVLCMETITAVCWGPLSFLTAYLVSAKHPLRYPLQSVVSLGQIYGDVLYYGTSMFDHYHKGLTYCRPEAYYFWIYYFAMNFVWIVIPGVLLYEAVCQCAQALRAFDDRQSHTRKSSNRD